MDFGNVLINLLLPLLCLIPALVHAIDSGERMINLKYANNGQPDFPDWNATYFFSHIIDVFDPPLTAITPVFLNTLDPQNNSDFSQVISGLQQRNIAIHPAVGKNDTFDINSERAMSIAMGYKSFADTIVIANCQDYYDRPTINGMDGPQNLTDMIDYLINTLGFAHITLDSWPGHGGNSVNYTQPQVDASSYQVHLAEYPNYTINASDPQNWEPQTHGLDSLHTVRPDAQIRIGYEDPPQQAALSMISMQAQLQAFNTTVSAIKQLNKDTFHGLINWAPPFSMSYNPIAEGTWNYIINTVETCQSKC